MGSRSRKGRLKAIAKQERRDAEAVHVSKLERTVLGLAEVDNKQDELPHVNLKYYDAAFECFSSWTAEELSAFSEFVRKLRESNWPAIYQTGGKLGGKTAFGYTVHKDQSSLPKMRYLDGLSPDITFFELRVNKRARVHGFRMREAFFLIWLDREHRIYKM